MPARSTASLTDRLWSRAQRQLRRDLSIRAFGRSLRSGRYRLVLVDYFGTLVTRTVPPWYVKFLAGRRLIEELGLDLDAVDLCRVRSEVEHRLTRAAIDRGDDPSYRLEDVALECAPLLLDSFGQASKRSTSLTDLAGRFIEADVKSEILVQSVDLTMLAELETHAGGEIKFALVSDFYIGNVHFQRFLDHHGLSRFFDSVFVSCDYGRTKKSGALFDVISDTLDCEPSEVLVVGDNPVADGHRPRAHGFRSHLVRGGRWERKRHGTSTDVEKHVERRVATLLEQHDPEDLFRPMALSLYVFVRRLRMQLRADGVDEAFFLTREGELLGRLFSIYEDETMIGDSGRIAARYLFVSRRSTYLPSLPALKDADFGDFLDRAPHPTTGDFLAALGFDGRTLELLASSMSRAAGGSGQLDLDMVVSNPSFAEEYERRRANQRLALVEYLDDVIDLAADRQVDLVDVGWRGGIQDHLTRLMPGDGPKLRGRYLGLVASDRLDTRDAKFGILFQNRPGPSAHLEVFAYFKTIFEVLLSADHGSVAGYSFEHGRATPIIDDIPSEQAAHQRFVAPVQERIERRFRALCRELERSPLDGDGLLHLAARHHATMVYKPSRAELRFFEQFPFYDAGRKLPRSVGLPPGEKSHDPSRVRSPRQVVRGGGWPPLRLRAARMAWLRYPYAWLKIRAHRRRARSCSCATSTSPSEP